jgi:hypothetical protein
MKRSADTPIEELEAEVESVGQKVVETTTTEL